MLINNLSAHLANHRDSIDIVVNRVLDRSWFVLGPEIQNFEKLFSDYLEVSHCRTVANGTDAIELALRAMMVSSGDQVATVANAGMYATTALLAIGAEPFYLDVDINSKNVTLTEVNRAIEAGVKAVVVTHLYGLVVPEIRDIAALCRKQSVRLLEDCAQAHGARVADHRVGTFGDAASFSFYPTKNLGALGDGGAVVTNNHEVAERVLRLRQYGWSSKYKVEMAGARNSRLDEIQAAILSVFLPDLDVANNRRRAVATKYSQSIHHPNVQVPAVYGEESVAHLYVVRVKERGALQEHLKSHGIASEVHYPIPDHRQPVFGNRYADLQLANTERLSDEVLTLPCFPEMTDAEIDRVVKTVNCWNAEVQE